MNDETAFTARPDNTARLNSTARLDDFARPGDFTRPGGADRASVARPSAEHLDRVQRRMDELAAHGVVTEDWRQRQADLWAMIRNGTVRSRDAPPEERSLGDGVGPPGSAP